MYQVTSYMFWDWKNEFEKYFILRLPSFNTLIISISWCLGQYPQVITSAPPPLHTPLYCKWCLILKQFKHFYLLLLILLLPLFTIGILFEIKHINLISPRMSICVTKSSMQSIWIYNFSYRYLVHIYIWKQRHTFFSKSKVHFKMESISRYVPSHLL